jgi:hypothetical protein
MSAPSLSETVGELRELLYDLRREAEDTGYGYFPGGDPNTFTPDPECSTEEERARHKADCEAWKSGKREGLTETRCQHFGDGKVSGLVTPSGYGLGTYTLEDEQAKDWAERLERAIAQLEGLAMSEDEQ